MCRHCEIEAKGQRSGKGSAFFSKYILGRYACEHSPDCRCEYCTQFRDKNEYADTGLFLGERKTVH